MKIGEREGRRTKERKIIPDTETILELGMCIQENLQEGEMEE